MLINISLCLNKSDTLTKIKSFIREDKIGYVCAVNLNILVQCYNNKDYLQIIKTLPLHFAIV